MSQAKGYKNGVKNNWRRTQWNRIMERLKIARIEPRDAVCLYLAGAEDLDRAEALRRGLRPWNLIAIERDIEICQRLRKSGVFCAHGDFWDVISGWNPRNRVDILVADFTGDIDHRGALNTAHMLDCVAFHNCVVSFNFQRGREAKLQAYRPKTTKHRGEHLCKLLSDLWYPEMERIHGGDRVALALWLDLMSMPKFLTYRSPTGRANFDSVIMLNPLRAVGLNAETQSTDDIRRRFHVTDPDGQAAAIGSLRATLAHRTRKFSDVLASANQGAQTEQLSQ